MLKQLLLTALLFISFINGFAADVTGKVIAKNNATLSKAAVSLFSKTDSSLVQSTLTNDDGTFQIANVADGSYFVYTTAFQFVTDSSEVFTISGSNYALPTIQLKAAEKSKPKSIDGVSVVAKKPFIEIKADKTVVNVENSINAAGSNALDILRKSPGVTVDKDDNIALKGKSGVLVYIDGKQTYLDNATIVSILKGTQSSAIESIEIISNPSAKYDAAGNAGIINIKMKKNKRLGTNGSVTAGLNYGNTLKENFNISVNNNNKRTNIFGLYNMDRGAYDSYINFFRNQGGQSYEQRSTNVNKNFSHNYKVGADYKLNSTKTFGVILSGNYDAGSWNSFSKTNISREGFPIDSVLVATNELPARKNNINANINYKYEDTTGRTLNIDLDAGNFFNRGNSYQPNIYQNLNGNTLSQFIFKNNTPIDINIYTAKADYEQNKWKGKLGFGVKSSFVNTSNDFQFYDVIGNVDQLNLQRSNHFTYKENVNAAYVNFNTAFRKKFTTQLGLRAEQTNSQGTLTSAQVGNNDTTVNRNYINLFPTASISYEKNSSHSFGLSFSRRIQRPSYQDLNPFENKIDELTYQKGNAFLKPQYAYSTDLTYTLFQMASIGLNHTYTKDLYAEITDTANGARAYITNKNLASSNNFGINISTPIPVRKWWFAFVNFGANFIKTKANFNGNLIDIKYPSMNFYAENNFTLPRDWAASVSGWWAMPGYWGGTFKTNNLGSMDIGLQKTFLQKKMTAKLSFTDVFWSTKWRGISDYAGLRLDANGGNESRLLRLSVSYKFGSNTVQKARQRETGLSEEADRIKKGK
jgi:iron complex outermembrane recepter protein